MKKKLEELTDAEIELQKKILGEIDKLPRNGCECHCSNKDKESYTYIFYGELPELMSVCPNCGGIIY